MSDATTKRRPSVGWVLAALGALVLGCGLSFWLGRGMSSGDAGDTASPGAAYYYCTMHTDVRQAEPGKCTKCPMELVPRWKKSGAAGDAPSRILEVSEAAARLADIRTARVERRAVSKWIALSGKIDFDETRVKTITAWVPGRLDRLYVDYTGVSIKKGEHLVEIYSPKLLAAQQELIEALKAVARLQTSNSPLVRASTMGTLGAVRDKLRLLGLSAQQIRAIEERGTPSDHTLIRAPIGGTVIAKLANQGDYVETGTPIYRIAELTHLWVLLDAYESDLPWLHYGQEVEFTTRTAPGETFRGRIHFIDWEVGKTRTTKVRVNVENKDRKLRPGTFVSARVLAALQGTGSFLPPSLKGKWISPMHPEIVKDGPGACDICGMDLVPASELFGKARAAGEPPLVIPATAPLVTGRRAVVYVKLPGRATPTFEGRDVLLGPRAGDHYVVVHGLREGEEVVVRGSFKIDSALQIDGQPSLMNPEGGGAGGGHHGQHGSHGGGESPREDPGGQKSDG